jgi:hypothetical protein
MKLMAQTRATVLSAVLLLAVSPGGNARAQWLTDGDRHGLDGCTIGVASGLATPDGRPLLWKTRDTDEPDNEARWCVAHPFSYIGVFNADGESPWMAVNERGFALLNANSLDLPGPGNPGNGLFMRRAIAECATVADFQRLLDSTNGGNRRTQAHFAVIDSTGAAALFETGSQQYWKYDAADGSVPEGYIVRTNFALHGGGSVGYQRYLRSRVIIAALRAADSLKPRGIIRGHHPVPDARFRGCGGKPLSGSLQCPRLSRSAPGIHRDKLEHLRRHFGISSGDTGNS